MTYKTHFTGTAIATHRILFCSGRAVEIADTSGRFDDVTCGACLRKLVAQSKKVIA